MKKLIAFFLLIGCLAGVFVGKTETINPLFNFDGVEKVCFVSDEKYDDFESVNCGNLVFNFCSLEKAKENLKEYCQNTQGIEFYFENISADKVLQKLKACVISVQDVDGMTVIMAYTPFYQDCIYVENKKANLQLAEKDGKLLVGFPAILTGF